MDTKFSEIICIVDRSGSMQAIRSDAIGGFNAFLAAQQGDPVPARLTLVLFDHEYLVPYQNEAIEDVSPLDETTYVPRGTTALLDAIGRTIDDADARLDASPEAERSGKVIVSILTDGLENASRDYTRDRAASMIKQHQEERGWEFIFLAANQDAIQEGASLSIGRQDVRAFAASGLGVRAVFSDLSDEVLRRKRGV